MVTSIDEARPDAVPHLEAGQPTSPEPPAEADPGADLYAEAELRLRHERTERLIQKASRDLT